jgi:cytochrome c oxidase subunit II
MNSSTWFRPVAASSVSGEYDAFFWALVVICGLVTIGIAIALLYFAIHYRRRSENQLPPQIKVNIPAEVTWIVLPFLFFMAMFAYGAKLYLDIERPPENAVQLYVVAKQWMWKIQHPEGAREINELHVPVGQSIKLNMTSQDVIHSFYIPAFRVKQDVLPDRFTTLWFRATKAGAYHLFCAEYCGTKHSGMIGTVYAMDPHDYQVWVDRGAAEGSLSSMGEKMFHQFGCANCHHFDGHGRGPNLQRLYGQTVRISKGGSVIADDTYIRESILDPRAKIVEGFTDLMPTFKGQISEEQIIQLIAYIRAIGPQPVTGAPQPWIGQPGTTAISGTQPENR